MKYCNAAYFIAKKLEEVLENMNEIVNDNYVPYGFFTTMRDVEVGIDWAERLENLLEYLEDENYIKGEM